MLNFFSLITCPIEVISSQDKVIGNGTGFFYAASEEDVYFVTNWHIVTGRNPENPNISENGAIPVSLRCWLHKKLEQDNVISRNQLLEFDIPINNEEGNDPNWFEHPDHAYGVDVVAIDLDRKQLEQNFRFNILSDYNGFQEAYSPNPMDNVFVIGYPLGLSAGNRVLPLYKRGSIASEPIVDSNLIFIDCRTNKGLSGAPVIVRHDGIWNPEGGNQMTGNTIIGSVTNFIGVYSGRLIKIGTDKKEEISEIGRVWKKALLDEIIEKKTKGTKIRDLS